MTYIHKEKPNKMFNKKLIKRLKQIGMTQRELAKEIGVTEAAVSRYIKGEREPSEDILLKIADAIEVAPEYFAEAGDQKVEDLAQIHLLIARNGKNMTSDEKMAIIELLSKK